MVSVNSHVLVMSTLAHILDRLKTIDLRLIDIEDAVLIANDDSDLEIDIDDEDADIDVDDDTAEAIADQLLDAADEIEESAIVPNHELVAMKLREIAEMLAQ
jgi:hypothetical protein